jgi:hypothetical protein
MDGIAKNTPQPSRWRFPTTKPAGLGVEMNQLIVGPSWTMLAWSFNRNGPQWFLVDPGKLRIFVGPAWLSHERRLEECGGGERASKR